VRRGGAELWVETSPDGSNWDHRPNRISGSGEYERFVIDLAPLEGRATGGMRLRIVADTANPAKSVVVDDVDVICVPPLEQYTGAADEYELQSGTSFAAPHVAGVAALLLSRDPGLTAAALRERILSTVEPVAGLAGKTITGGRLSAARALAVAPAAAAKARRLKRRSLLRRGGFTERGLVAPGPGRLTVALRANGTIAKGARRVARAGTYSVRCRLTRSGRKRLRRVKRATLVLRFRPPSGAAVTSRVAVRLVE
jgi:subtilisin family serine protease